MANERLYIYNTAGALVYDPRKFTDFAADLSYGSRWPKGFADASFTISRDILEQFPIKMGYKLRIMDGQKTLWQGRLGAPEFQRRSGVDKITITAQGWYVVLTERRLRKRWVDSMAVSRLLDNKRNNEQRAFIVEKKEADMVVKISGSEQSFAGTERYEVKYVQPSGQTTKRFTLNHRRLGGDDKNLTITDGGGTSLFTDSTLPTTDTAIDHTLATPHQTVIIKIGPTGGLYDDQDGVAISDLTFYSETGTIDAKAIIEDVLAALVTEISVDYDQIVTPGFTIDPFITEGDAPETGDSIITRAVNYGDSSFRTYGFSVWDDVGTSDSKPKGQLNYRDITTWKWETTLADLQEFTLKDGEEAIENYIWTHYLSASGIDVYRSPIDASSTTDATSVAAYGRRDSEVIELGNSFSTQSDNIAQRRLSYHKDPLPQARFVLGPRVRRKGGGLEDSNRIRAGEAIKILDYRGGTVFWPRSVSVKCGANQTVTIEPDLAPDNLVTFMLQRELG